MRRFEAALEDGKEVNDKAVADTAVALQTAWAQLQNWEGANDIRNFLLVNDDDPDDVQYALDLEALDDAGWRHVVTIEDRDMASQDDLVQIWCTPSLEYVFFYQQFNEAHTGAAKQEKLDKVKITPGFLFWLATKIPARQSRR
jgi:hypothetical protein